MRWLATALGSYGIIVAFGVVGGGALGCGPTRPAGIANVPVAFTPEPGVVDLSERLREVRAKRRVPALAAAAFDSQRLLGIGAIGERQMASGQRVTVDDRWHLGSNTKPMTATLMARFVDRGQVRWNMTLEEAFVGLPIDAGWRPVTLGALLSHRGGAPEDINASAPALWKHMVQHRAPEESASVRSYVAAELLRASPPETPGSVAYSNAGFMIAGAALERIASASWEDLMVREIFEPLGIKGCGFGAVGRCDRAGSLPCEALSQPVGHRPVGEDRYVPIPPGPSADNPPSLGPAGTVHCDLRSWGRFLQEHLRAARGEATSVASNETLRQLHVSQGDKFGLGWGVTTRRWANGPVLFTVGSNTLNYSTVWIAPRLDRIFVAVSNGGSRDDFLAVDDAIGVLLEAFGS